MIEAAAGLIPRLRLRRGRGREQTVQQAFDLEHVQHVIAARVQLKLLGDRSDHRFSDVDVLRCLGKGSNNQAELSAHGIEAQRWMIVGNFFSMSWESISRRVNPIAIMSIAGMIGWRALRRHASPRRPMIVMFGARTHGEHDECRVGDAPSK